MRLSLFILALLAINVYTEKPAAAQDGAWCAEYNFAFGGARNCGFATYQQCLATVRGVGGSCTASPSFQLPPYQRYRRGYPY